MIAIACFGGAATTGWWIADQRLLYVEIVPPERRTEYLALYYAWIGLVGGCGPLIAGPVLDAAQGGPGALTAVIGAAVPGDVVLVKASRGVEPERDVDELVAALGGELGR